MSQPDEFETRFNEARELTPEEIIMLLPLSREDIIRAERLLCPAARPAKTAGGSAEVETPGPAL